MSRTEEERAAVSALVDRILERGRLHQREIEGEIGVRDGGIGLAKTRFVDEILSYAKTEAIEFADNLIGAEVTVREQYLDPNEEEPVPNQADEAVQNFQRKQRIALAEYHNPTQPAAQPIDDDDIVRIDPKTAQVSDEPSRLVNDERSEAEA